jgi:hypothetical protein
VRRDEDTLDIALKSYCQRRLGNIRLNRSQTRMKSISSSLLGCVIVIGALLAQPNDGNAAKSTTGPGQSGDSSWPRERVQDGNRLIDLVAEDFAGAVGSGADDENYAWNSLFDFL